MSKQFSHKQSNEVKFLYLLAGLVFLVAFGLLGWFGWGFLENNKYFFGGTEGAGQDLSVPDISMQDCQFRRILDGVCVRDKDGVNPKLVAVMVDNHPDGRPLSGLAEASVVYEAPVEANYTRFLAIYPANAEVKDVGPVRSARPYYLDWVSEYGDAMYMHVGGSPEALSLIREYKIFDLNEFYRGWYYWRDRNRFAPHYIYTSSELWGKALADYADERSVAEYEGWSFNTSSLYHRITSSLGEDELAASVKITFLAPDYVAEWKFNTSTRKYERYQ
ncbi:MAG: DUF3048 domain-containing protein, partial [Candidatus Magasanikbacteria bacterium]|nr:DUF3048 domain-containing protein [Candidatus Magasanikbacteria bacterium]